MAARMRPLISRSMGVAHRTRTRRHFPNLKMGPSYSRRGPELPRAGGGAKVPSAFFHASANANGALRDNRYHVIAAFMNISGMIMLPVNKSTIGYCSPFVVDGPFPLPVILPPQQ